MNRTARFCTLVTLVAIALLVVAVWRIWPYWTAYRSLPVLLDLAESEAYTFPTAGTAAGLSDTAAEIQIQVDPDGTTRVNGEIMTSTQLQDHLSQISQKLPDQRIILRGDEEASFSTIMRVLDTCQKAGLWNMAFSAEHLQSNTP